MRRCVRAYLMEERTILHHIGELVEEEHRLRSAMQNAQLDSEDERARLRVLEHSLDQCWDVLRRRRAASDYARDPDSVEPRPVDEVEGYLQ